MTDRQTDRHTDRRTPDPEGGGDIITKSLLYKPSIIRVSNGYLPLSWGNIYASDVPLSILSSVCALWLPAGKGLTSWISFVVSICEFVTFPLVSWVRSGT